MNHSSNEQESEQNKKPADTSSFTEQDIKQYLQEGKNDKELIIGIVNAVGTENGLVIKPLEERLKGFGYTVHKINVSKLLEFLKEQQKAETETEYKRIKSFMELGDFLRKNCRESIKSYGVLSYGIAKKIEEFRKENSKNAYIISSLKHPDEVELLRRIYSLNFYLLGIHAEKERRLEFLTKDKQCTPEEAEELITIDEAEEESHGQQTRDTYHLSDFFLALGSNSDYIKNTLQRFLELIFSHPYKNPTFDEYAMYMAFSSSIRSADLSRQVGAIISSKKQIIATGANDAPQSEGGLYWATVEKETGIVKDSKKAKDYTR